MASCPPDECDDCGTDCPCPPIINDSEFENEALLKVVNLKQANCFTYKTLFVSMIWALWQIADAIREWISSQPVIIATGVLQYRILDYPDIDSGDDTIVELGVSPFNYEVVGFGTSYRNGEFTPTGVYTNDDKLKITLWNLTTNSACGSTLELSLAIQNNRDINGGSPIGANINVGNRYGVKIKYEDSEGETLDTPIPFDIFVFIRPAELNP